MFSTKYVLNIFYIIMFTLYSTRCQMFGDGMQNPSIATVDAKYNCPTSKIIQNITRNNFIEGKGAKCNQIKRDQLTIELSIMLKSDTIVNVPVTGQSYIFDYGGMRTVIFNGQVDPSSQYCAEDRMVIYEKAIPKMGNCERGIILHEALSSFIRIGGICDAFCTGKVLIEYTTPLGSQRDAREP